MRQWEKLIKQPGRWVMRIAILALISLFLFSCAPPGFPTPGTPGQPPPEPPKPPEFTQEEAVRLAKQHLALRLSIPVEEITVVSVEKVDWPDTSLGLPEPDKVYAQVIVPGFKISLRASGQDYLYHAGWLKNKMVVVPVPRRGS